MQSIGLVNLEINVGEMGATHGHLVQSIYVKHTSPFDGVCKFHRVDVSRYFSNPVQIATLGWAPLNMFTVVFKGLEAAGYRAHV